MAVGVNGTSGSKAAEANVNSTHTIETRMEPITAGIS